MVKIATINILFELDLWMQRRELLVEGLAAEKADLIGLQEVNWEENTGMWLAEQLGMSYVYIVPYQDPARDDKPRYGAAIISRYPFIHQADLDLQGQGRRAQYVQVEIDNQPLIFCNGHYYWETKPSTERMKQMQLLTNWLGELPAEMPIVAVGDFNALPDSPDMIFMREKFVSAYAVCNGKEPEYTCPSALLRPKYNLISNLKHRFWRLLLNGTLKPFRGTLDYIYINQHLTVRDCRVILNQPAPDNKRIYPSDHFGLAADLLIGN
ncbi:MAG: endonuclease/exonuclease/phosphatase family protein [Cyanomargarita calcarea GSE-NOS-MK-12-04C]|jgi:endonuclease/exonuclease/phosphatase family metal-dependent hydrolase|uniref:Endonuclease/exonuclease/phosphatase family protein n=1 Tax=Cyanomargarita calcarea GSE-NOS-MK-12-04C TaxID=2839659 RepID=A0A951QGN1_9CYAN|nr:endonuclease/exonuclease/phosphatase family protein [Cyanomargarita calcarea GSE-NOS-MK-12-04C]